MNNSVPKNQITEMKQEKFLKMYKLPKLIKELEKHNRVFNKKRYKIRNENFLTRRSPGPDDFTL